MVTQGQVRLTADTEPGGGGRHRPEGAPGGGGREGRTAGGGGPGQEPGPGRPAHRGLPAPGAAQRPAPRPPDRSPYGPGHAGEPRPSCWAGAPAPCGWSWSLVFFTLIVRLVAVQEFAHQHYASLSTSELTQTVTVPAVRGGIYDRNGEVLAESVTSQTVVADPLLITHPAATAAALSPVLGIPADQLRSRAHRALRLRLPGPPGVRRGGRQGDRPRPDRHQPGPRVPAGRARRAAGPCRWWARWDGTAAGPPGSSTSTSRCWPAGRVGEPAGGARRGGPARGRDRSVAARARHRGRADPRRVGPVRGRAGPRRRDRRLPRLQRHRGGHGREDRATSWPWPTSRPPAARPPPGPRPPARYRRCPRRQPARPSGPTLVSRADTLPAGVEEAPPTRP